MSELLPAVVTSASASGLWKGQAGQDRFKESTPDEDSDTNRTPSGRGAKNESFLPNLKETKRRERDYVTTLAQPVPRILPTEKEQARSWHKTEAWLGSGWLTVGAL